MRHLATPLRLCALAAALALASGCSPPTAPERQDAAPNVGAVHATYEHAQQPRDALPSLVVDSTASTPHGATTNGGGGGTAPAPPCPPGFLLDPGSGECRGVLGGGGG